MHSIICSLVFDLLIGVFVSYMIWNTKKFTVIKFMMDLTSLSDRLKFTVEWMMGFPYGFKPNKELDNFLGGCMISLLDGWKAGS